MSHDSQLISLCGSRRLWASTECNSELLQNRPNFTLCMAASLAILMILARRGSRCAYTLRAWASTWAVKWRNQTTAASAKHQVCHARIQTRVCHEWLSKRGHMPQAAGTSRPKSNGMQARRTGTSCCRRCRCSAKRGPHHGGGPLRMRTAATAATACGLPSLCSSRTPACRAEQERAGQSRREQEREAHRSCKRTARPAARGWPALPIWKRNEPTTTASGAAQPRYRGTGVYSVYRGIPSSWRAATLSWRSG